MGYLRMVLGTCDYFNESFIRVCVWESSCVGLKNNMWACRRSTLPCTLPVCNWSIIFFACAYQRARAKGRAGGSQCAETRHLVSRQSLVPSFCSFSGAFVVVIRYERIIQSWMRSRKRTIEGRRPTTHSYDWHDDNSRSCWRCCGGGGNGASSTPQNKTVSSSGPSSACRPGIPPPPESTRLQLAGNICQNTFGAWCTAVNLGFTRAFIYSNRLVCSVCFCSPLVLFWTFCTASPARWECIWSQSQSCQLTWVLVGLMILTLAVLGVAITCSIC